MDRVSAEMWTKWTQKEVRVERGPGSDMIMAICLTGIFSIRMFAQRSMKKKGGE